jgi:hypothetical protein
MRRLRSTPQSLETRLSQVALGFSPFVIAGLDPAIIPRLFSLLGDHMPGSSPGMTSVFSPGKPARIDQCAIASLLGAKRDAGRKRPRPVLMASLSAIAKIMLITMQISATIPDARVVSITQ